MFIPEEKLANFGHKIDDGQDSAGMSRTAQQFWSVDLPTCPAGSSVHRDGIDGGCVRHQSNQYQR